MSLDVLSRDIYQLDLDRGNKHSSTSSTINIQDGEQISGEFSGQIWISLPTAR
jgi:hypothetical protein